MIEHWYDFLPAAWFTPEGRWNGTTVIDFNFGGEDNDEEEQE